MISKLSKCARSSETRYAKAADIAVRLHKDEQVISAWEEQAPDFGTIIKNLTKMQKMKVENPFFIGPYLL